MEKVNFVEKWNALGGGGPKDPGRPKKIARSESAIGHGQNPGLKGKRRNDRTVQEFQGLSPGLSSILRLFERTFRIIRRFLGCEKIPGGQNFFGENYRDAEPNKHFKEVSKDPSSQKLYFRNLKGSKEILWSSENVLLTLKRLLEIWMGPWSNRN